MRAYRLAGHNNIMSLQGGICCELIIHYPLSIDNYFHSGWGSIGKQVPNLLI